MAPLQRKWQREALKQPFDRLRTKTWNRRAIWRYSLLLILVFVIFQLLKSV